MDSDSKDMLEFEGIVESVIRDRVFVKIESGQIICCVISGKIRESGIRICNNDVVKIVVSPYDLTKGRVVYRLKS